MSLYEAILDVIYDENNGLEFEPCDGVTGSKLGARVGIRLGYPPDNVQVEWGHDGQTVTGVRVTVWSDKGVGRQMIDRAAYEWDGSGDDPRQEPWEG